MPDPEAPIINDEADRLLGRIIIRYGLMTFALLVAATIGMAFVNIPHTRLFPARRFLDTLSILVVLIPFFVGINRLFAARLRLGRELATQRRWREAIAALDPFAGPSQRFLDHTGEAHYWLARAYAGAGDTQKAEAALAFVLRHRPGVWAERIRTASPLARPPKQEKRPRPSNGRRRRRF